MLRWFDADQNLAVEDIPHRREYAGWVKRLSRAEQDAAFAYIEQLVEQGGDIHTSSFMPGPDWTGTPLQTLYETAANYSEQQAGWCFGLMLMETMIRRDDQWYCKKDLEFTEGTIYWKG
jgi:hypothetical protein